MDSHLWLVLSDPIRDPRNIILVNFTTLTDEKEAVCVVNAGEHPRVTHPTCVNYRQALNVSMEQLRELERGEVLDFQTDLSEGLLKRIRDSAADSRHFPEAFYEILLDQDLIVFADGD